MVMVRLCYVFQKVVSFNNQIFKSSGTLEHTQHLLSRSSGTRLSEPIKCVQREISLDECSRDWLLYTTLVFFSILSLKVLTCLRYSKQCLMLVKQSCCFIDRPVFSMFFTFTTWSTADCVLNGFPLNTMLLYMVSFLLKERDLENDVVIRLSCMSLLQILLTSHSPVIK